MPRKLGNGQVAGRLLKVPTSLASSVWFGSFCFCLCHPLLCSLMERSMASALALVFFFFLCITCSTAASWVVPENIKTAIILTKELIIVTALQRDFLWCIFWRGEGVEVCSRSASWSFHPLGTYHPIFTRKKWGFFLKKEKSQQRVTTLQIKDALS